MKLHTRIHPGRRQVTVVLSALLVASALVAVTVAPASGVAASDVVPGQVIVKIDPLAGVGIDAINATHGTSTLRPLAVVSGIYLLGTPAGVPLEDLMDELEEDARLLYAEANSISEAPETSRHVVYAWGGITPRPEENASELVALRLEEAHAISTGTGTVIAVVDTGAQLDHPELMAALVGGFDFIDGDAFPDDVPMGIDSDGDGTVDEGFGHGTHAAGVLRIVAPGAGIMPLRVLDSEGRGNVAVIGEAIVYAVDHGADVINLSFGAPTKSKVVRDAVREATSRGVVVVGAAGNLGSSRSVFPAADSCVLGTTATEGLGVLAEFANFGSWVAFAAPGESVFAAFPPSGFAWGTGTSVAAPFVAGQAALINSVRPEFDARQVAAVISATSQGLDELNPDRGIRAGMPDVAASLEGLATAQVPSTGTGLISGSCVG